MCWEVRPLGGKKGGALTDGSLLKETPESSLTLSTRWGHSEKKAIYELQGRPSVDPESAYILILNFRHQSCEEQISVIYMSTSLG